VAEFLGEANLFADGAGFRLVRPEKMSLSATSVHGAMAGEVSDIAYFGDRTRYLVRRAEGRPLLVSRASLGPPLPLAIGDTAWVSFDPSDAVSLPA
jgi:ABC-type Fe3+/spermidine/putrescine transport system ATPase subunit